MSESKEESKDNKYDRKIESKNDHPVCVLTDDEVLEHVQELFYTEINFHKDIENFAEKHANRIDIDCIDRNEYSLEHTKVYEEYKNLFESRLEIMITRGTGCTVQRFYNALQNKIDNDPTGNDAFFVEVILTFSSFDMFMAMLREKALEMRRK